MSTLYQCVKGCKETFDVVEMKSGGRFVEDEEGRVLSLLSDEISEFDALVLTAGQCRGVLSEPDISESNVLQRLEAVDDSLCESVFGEELDRLVYSHVEYVMDILPLVSHLEYVVLEAFAVTCLAFEFEVGHELHLDGYRASTLAFLTASALGIEGEMLWREAHLL